MSSNMAYRGPHRVAGEREKALRSKPFRAIVAVALAVPLLLGAAFLAVDRLHSTPADALEHPAEPVSDDQSRSQVIQPTKHIVTVTGLHTTSAGYSFMSCKNRDEPPYQGAIYLTFAVPAAMQSDSYLAGVVATLVGRGWTEGVSPNNHAFATTLTKDAVTVIVYRHDDDPRLGVLRVYGECRNMHNHRRDAAAWSDITDQFSGTR